MDFWAIDCLDVKMGLGAVAGVSASAEGVADLHVVSRLNLDAAALEVTQRDHCALMLDEHMVPRERYPAFGGSLALGQRVNDRREPAIRRVVGLGIVRGENDAVDGCQNLASEPGELLRGFWTKEREGRDRCSTSFCAKRHKVNGIGRGKLCCAVAGHPVGGAVLDEPSAAKRVGQLNWGTHSMRHIHAPRSVTARRWLQLGAEALEAID